MSAVLHFERIDQTDARVAWSGTWSTDSAADGSYGKGHRYANATGASATCTWYGTRVAIRGIKLGNAGYAKCYIDGDLVTTVDTYAASREDQTVIFESDQLALGPHTVKVEVDGGKNPASSGTYINIDAFDVYNDDIQAPYERIHANKGYFSAFSTVNDAGAFGGWAYYRASAAILDFALYGERVVCIGRKGPNQGIAEVFLDGVSQGPVDLYQASNEWQAILWDSGAIADGVHWVRIASTGSRNPSSAGATVTVNAFDVYRSVTPPIEQVRDDGVATYMSANWGLAPGEAYYGGSLLFSNTAGAFADLDCYGNRLRLYGRKNTNFGHMGVYLGGILAETVDLYAAANVNQVLLWDSGPLESGVHRLRLTRVGTKNASATDYYVGLDFIRISNALTPSPAEAAAEGFFGEGTEPVVSGLRRTYPAMVRTYPPLQGGRYP